MPIGITVGRQILHVSVLAEEDREATVRRAGPALQGGTPIPAVAVRT
jgi:hypothetical protein